MAQPAAADAMARMSGAAAAAAKGPGYIGIHGEPAGGVGPGLRVLEVDPGSPAAKADVIVGDTLRHVAITNMLMSRFQPTDSEQALDTILLQAGPGKVVRLSGDFRNTWMGDIRLAAVPEGLKPPAAVSAPSADAVEATRTTYLSMCGRGAEKLGAATCAALKRDLDAAVAQREEAARVAEVLANHRALCGPGATTGLSKATCDAMLAEAKR